MKQLIQTIYTHFNANVEGATKLYNTIASPSADFPYVVLLLIPGVPDDTFTERSETGIVQFSIYSDEPLPDVALAIKTSIQSAFDYTRELTMSDYILISFRREIGLIAKEEIKGKLVWSVMIQYSFIVERN